MGLPDNLIPADDEARWRALGRYQQLSTLGEPLFNELVRLAAKLFAAPIALVSLVEEHSVSFPGNVGLPEAERVARNISMCSVAILQEETTVFADLKAEPCTLTDPFLVRALNLQFYAGHALRTADGFAIGTLCVIDRQPRPFSAKEGALLESLAAVVMQVFELRAAMAEDPAVAPALWETMYARIEPSLLRINTLAELTQWEETPNTPSALAYRVSQYEEATHIADTLRQEMSAALLRLA
jgi:hypothetical protein